MIQLFSFLLWYRTISILLSAFIFFSCQPKSTDLKITPAKNYPRWLMNDKYHTNQTSGITFLSKSNDGIMQFLLADDIGKIHRFFIREDTLFSFSEIKFDVDIINYFANFPKPDFEEIFYDKFSNDVYLTVEGNGENYLSYHGIYKLIFKDNDIYQDSITGIKKLDFEPRDIFYKSRRR